MSEFHRMITYLYLYEQGTKSRNTGFAKVERRAQRCLLEIHMKNTGCSMSPVPVYFYVQKETRLAGISLGNFSLTRGSGDFKTVLDAGNLKDSGYKLDDVKGIYIPLTEGMILVSQWDDDDFCLEDFVDLSQDSSLLQAAGESMPVQETENPSSAPMPKADDSPSTRDTEDSKCDGVSASADSKSIDAKISTTSKSTGESASADSKSTGVSELEVSKTAGVSESEVSEPANTPKAEDSKSTATTTTENKSTSASKADTQKAETSKSADALKAVEALPRPERYSQADEPEDWDLRWRFILENYPVMTPFAGDEHTFCVRMELKDLRQLPKQFWYFGNNSFLLHGFFNYRYFILGMTEEFGVKKWFIGVPGVFQNPERVMAALFGFPEFRSEKPSPINTGEFGYWYRYLNELSEPSKK